MNRVVALAVAAAALALYTATLAPGLLWGGGDFARFQTWAYLGRIEGPFDVFAHPLWVYLAHPFTRLPIADPAWRANFASAFFAAAAIGVVFGICRMAAGSLLAALLATGALAVSHVFWTYAVMPKVYSLNALLLAVCLYLLLRWRASRDTVLRSRRGAVSLALGGLVYGIGFLNHIVMATAAAGLAAFVVLSARDGRSGQPGRAIAIALASFLAGVAPFVLLSAREGAEEVGIVLRFIAGLAYAFTHPRDLAEGIGWGIAAFAYQFPLTAPLAAIGLVSLWRRDRPLAVAVAFTGAATIAFLLGALDPSIDGAYVWNLHYYLQAYVAAAPALACGFAWLESRWMRGRPERALAAAIAALAVPVIVYAVAPSLARRAVREVPDFRPLPGRDNFAYVFTPWKQGETAPRPYAESLLAAVPRGGVLFADYGPWAMLHYLQVVEGARPDVEVVLLRGAQTQMPEILSRGAREDMFLADTYRYYDLRGIRARFDLIPTGPIYRLRAKVSNADRSDSRSPGFAERP